MNRASSMMSGLLNVNAIKVGRLGGYYNLKYYVHCDYLVANTPDIKEYIISEGWDKNKVVYIPNFACKSNLKNRIKNKKKIILFYLVSVVFMKIKILKSLLNH